jgi:hypothetical protein
MDVNKGTLFDYRIDPVEALLSVATLVGNRERHIFMSRHSL